MSDLTSWTSHCDTDSSSYAQEIFCLSPKGTLTDTEQPATEPCPQPDIYSTYPHNFPAFLSTHATNIVCIPQYKFNIRATCIYPVR